MKIFLIQTLSSTEHWQLHFDFQNGVEIELLTCWKWWGLQKVKRQQKTEQKNQITYWIAARAPTVANHFWSFRQINLFVTTKFWSVWLASPVKVISIPLNFDLLTVTEPSDGGELVLWNMWRQFKVDECCERAVEFWLSAVENEVAIKLLLSVFAALFKYVDCRENSLIMK